LKSAEEIITAAIPEKIEGGSDCAWKVTGTKKGKKGGTHLQRSKKQKRTPRELDQHRTIWDKGKGFPKRQFQAEGVYHFSCGTERALEEGSERKTGKGIKSRKHASKSISSINRNGNKGRKVKKRRTKGRRSG